MTVTSFYFFVFLLCGFAVYYITPGKFQWVTLLLLSLAFYHFVATDYTIFFLLGSTVLAYISSNLLSIKKVAESPKAKKYAAAAAVIAVLGNIIVWFLLKGSSFWITSTKLLHHFFPSLKPLGALPIVGALGMGYYTAQVIGYILDCYWGNVKPQKNFLKLFLFVCFFPQLTVGPISRYGDMQCLYEKHKFSYDNMCLGCQRILWGVFKKLVISDRVGLLISGIWSGATVENGFYPWIAMLLYPLQIYTDFSGCMDIVLGAAELFDIHLAENFKNPFFSRSVQEFWQRWHITLGGWARDYVYYPVLKSKPILAIGKWSKKHFKNHKRIAKLIPWAVGNAVLWFVMGFWHGSVQHIFGVSMWFWTILLLSEIFSPWLKRIVEKLKINTDCFSYRLFQRVRMYLIYALGVVFFSAPGLRSALSRYGVLFEAAKHPSPWIFFDNSVTKFGLTFIDVNLIIFGVLLLIIVAVLREKYGYARTWMQKQNLPFRWIVWLSLFLIVLIYGMYGPGYNAAEFIYEGF